jgi:hypothetical protein
LRNVSDAAEQISASLRQPGLRESDIRALLWIQQVTRKTDLKWVQRLYRELASLKAKREPRHALKVIGIFEGCRPLSVLYPDIQSDYWNI